MKSWSQSLLVMSLVMSTACRTKSAAAEESEFFEVIGPASISKDDVKAPEPPEWKVIRNARPTMAQFELDSVPSDGIEKHMLSGSDAQGIPKSVQGIWWMDGNKLAPGNLTTFGTLAWDFPHHRALVTEYGAGNYTFDDSAEGRKSFESNLRSRLAFTVVFNQDYDYAQLYQRVDLPGSDTPIDIPKFVIDYKMRLVGDGDWLRKSRWVQIPIPDYHLRRIVDAEGNRVEPAYSNWLKIATPNQLLSRAKTSEP